MLDFVPQLLRADLVQKGKVGSEALNFRAFQTFTGDRAVALKFARDVSTKQMQHLVDGACLDLRGLLQLHREPDVIARVARVVLAVSLKSK